MAFLDPSSSILTTIQDFFNILDQIGPELQQLIKNWYPAQQQHIMMVRVRRCKTHCRHNHYKIPQVDMLVNLDFLDMTQEQRDEIAKLICFELKLSL